jgi:hypothetical protein
MTITIAELQRFKDSMIFMTQLRSMPIEIIEFYLENERGYLIKAPESGEGKTVLLQPPASPK